jgi:hypothetical protein
MISSPEAASIAPAVATIGVVVPAATPVRSSGLVCAFPEYSASCAAITPLVIAAMVGAVSAPVATL